MSSQLTWLAISKLPGRAGAPSTRTFVPQMRATPLRNRRGQLDRPVSLDSRCGTTHTRNQPPNAAIRTAARQRDDGASAVAIAGDAIELHAMVDQAVAEPVGDPPLQLFELLVGEFDDLAGLDIDQMVMMRFGGGFVARSAVAKFVPFKDSSLLEQSYRAIDGGN